MLITALGVPVPESRHRIGRVDTPHNGCVLLALRLSSTLRTRASPQTTMLCNNDWTLHQGGGGRARGGTRETKPRSLRISQVEGRRFHRFCSRNTVLGVPKMMASHLSRSDGQEHLPDWETKAIIIQRAWRNMLYRKQSWSCACEDNMCRLCNSTPEGPLHTAMVMDTLCPDACLVRKCCLVLI
ncbi:hypothetical protein GN956_G8749 [Arapaima gigas]